MQNFQLRLKCDEIQNQQDEMEIQNTLAQSPGIDIVEVDIQRHEIKVTTANQDKGIDVIRRLDDAGFTCERAT